MTSLATYIVALAGLFGLIIGSFLNVVAYRVPAHISLLRESRCPQCDAPVRPWQNVPVVSWIALEGEVRELQGHLSLRDPDRRRNYGHRLRSGDMVGSCHVPRGFGRIGRHNPRSLNDWRRGRCCRAVGIGLMIVAFLYFAAISVLLTLIDLDTHRLPGQHRAAELSRSRESCYS